MSSITTRTSLDDHSVLLGIDIGSVSISVVEINPDREICKSAYQFHYGNIAETFTKIMNDFDLGRIRGIAATSSTPSILKANRQYDNRVAIIAAARQWPER
jgi:activator of 2-hydroxyglutaryl-CoA dehydratase